MKNNTNIIVKFLSMEIKAMAFLTFVAMGVAYIDSKLENLKYIIDFLDEEICSLKAEIRGM